MGCHPADDTGEHWSPSGTHNISFYCDDIEKTVEELKGRGVEFVGPVVDAGFGLATHFMMPGDLKVQPYQPYYSKGRLRCVPGKASGAGSLQPAGRLRRGSVSRIHRDDVIDSVGERGDPRPELASRREVRSSGPVCSHRRSPTHPKRRTEREVPPRFRGMSLGCAGV